MKWSPVLRAGGVLLPALLLAGWGVSGALRSASQRKEELPVMKKIPPFSLEERSGRTVKLDDLLGRVWVADFIFTNCGGSCPLMTGQMRRVQEALGSDSGQVVLVSFTVDPERDTREALSSYASKNGAAEGWIFLRGPRDVMVRLSREGFLLGASPTPGEPGIIPPAGAPPLDTDTEPLAHAKYFALVDRQGAIRGYYDGTDPSSVAVLARDARALLGEKTQ